MDLASGFTNAMRELKLGADTFVPEIVRLILTHARQAHASDVHLIPESDGMRMQWRLDGVLQTVARFDAEIAPRLVARLKVVCGLLTYRTDVPQEGRVAREYSSLEIRVTTFPTLYGEKAAIRLFAESTDLQQLQQLGLPESIEQRLRIHLQATDGVILLTGPSGSGKTTTVYACLREILAASGDGRGIMTLEDPIEVAVPGTTQSQVRSSAGFDLPAGLRSLMRQDPDVIMVGEIRDPATAEVVFQAALTGHLVLTTFHAGSAVEAMTRLMDMQIEPYVLRSSLRSIVCQRLVRRLAPDLQMQTCGADRSAGHAADTSDSSAAIRENWLDKPAELADHSTVAYRGRMVLAEMLDPDVPEIAQAILSRWDSRKMAVLLESMKTETLQDAASRAVRLGLTTPAEVFRVLGRSALGKQV